MGIPSRALRNRQPIVPQTLAITDVLWEPLIPYIEKANRAVAHYEGVLYGVPNPEVWLSSLTTQEAVLSLKYYRMDRPDPLVQLAVVHAQFEILHSFCDGNGRLDRILIPLFLAEKQILSGPMFHLSAYLEAHRNKFLLQSQTDCQMMFIFSKLADRGGSQAPRCTRREESDYNDCEGICGAEL